MYISIHVKYPLLLSDFNHNLTLWLGIIFFLILAHPVYKTWIIQETNMLELWNKLRFEEEKTEIICYV